MVQVIWLVIAVLALFSAGYLGYSRYLAQFVELDDSRETPAHKYEDGQEYVPAKKPVLLGHHYSSIAGGAPIVGPITAGVVWGWVPALAWIAIGNPLMGSVHDFVSLSASLRHEGRSIGYIIGEYVGERGKNMLLWFAFLTIILVVGVFALVVAIVFNAYPEAATASLIYIGLAVLLGAYLYQLDLPFIPGTIAFVVAMFVGVWVGIQYPLALFEPASRAPAQTTVLLSGIGTWWLPASDSLGANTAAWVPIILVYGAFASALPVWVLLQPRDYLSSFLLYTGVGGALLAVIVGTVGGALGISAVTPSQPLVTNLDPFYGFIGRSGAPLFPLLFITIACGTISGFHSLVSSGTTAKQLNRESDARIIGYGGMLGEGLLATVALITVALVAPNVGGGIGLALPTFATGGGVILTSFGIPASFGAPFMALVLVSFLLTSTDTAVRLGRYMMEEIVGTPGSPLGSFAVDRYGNAVAQALPAYLLVTSGSWLTLWQLFGGANQLLAALALLTATVWLANWSESKQLISTGGPMVVMVFITVMGLLWLALHDNVYAKFLNDAWMESATTLSMVSAAVQVVVAFVLMYLALSLVLMGYRNIRRVRENPSEGGFSSGDD
ncbi:carbon starvation protein, membrane protein [Halogeometricum borinquense DSM 11551]|uniref:Carbon starvation protein, membrane protein n=2 Tax=Halogeometricum borinquense TaxID=60847 RepID=E4NTE1_HALBP|nr:carbon starvation protein A [Halogeometricum borinquense]ADQ65886.1 carbon starvation protein, predicted membrane protein [Halogeometricum borinquense DSM 11551]ELY26888.1 carbon starvation protein, membrane protein [Halogeometricum borinquense DSM 11551]RYJ14219.1 carbon starvation protein A [Halogeometricum borinquense]